ncbi:hypothetical protein ACEWY4_022694 [Coilia grayii]|uniref:B30.2/SPRY domain-containing protein n=1 Tax=Coilia grayii TaxID=363190 RepID=A0ABD1J3Z7_9TELE
MSVLPEREEARSETHTPESAALHPCVTIANKDTDAVLTTRTDAGPQTERCPSPVPSLVSMKSDVSIIIPPSLPIEPAPSDLTEWESEDHSGSQHRKTWRNQSLLGEHAGGAESSKYQQTEHTDDGALKKLSENYKGSLKKRVENISENRNKPESDVPINEIYTELYITEGKSEVLNKEHEVWQVEEASRNQTTEDTPIKCNDIFKPLTGQEKPIRTVMTKGVAGIGKTVSVQKFILDWTDEKANQNIDFMFSIPFRELNLARSRQYSLQTLLLAFHPELKDGEEYKDYQVAFIFDGLDESRISLNFQSKMLVSDVKQIASVDDLVTSLIQGCLLPSAFIWITSRPTAASQIPADFFDRVTEIRGFSDSQKEKYFRKRISDESQANKIISHIKASRCLHTMCHIPVFCSIVATVLQQILQQDKVPKTLTEIFIHFLLFQTTKKNQPPQKECIQYNSKTEEDRPREAQKEIILKLAKLAFKNLGNGRLMFYEEDLRECGIDVSKPSMFSGLCTEIFKEEVVFNQKKVYCFVHLSVQEFLAALHMFGCYTYQMEDMGIFFCLEQSLKFAITKALESENGHLDLFLRFLVGISLESNQRLLQGLLNHSHSSARCISNICQYIKELNREDLSPERCVNLFHCLFEMNDDSMHKEIQIYLSSKNFQQKLSPAHCSALAHMLLMSEKVLDEFDLKKYNTTNEGRRRLLPAVTCAKRAQLDGCNLNKLSCETVNRCLLYGNSLRELDLSHNALGDSGVEILSAGLNSPHCKLQTLRLVDSKLSAEAGRIMGDSLQSPNALIELDLSHNDLGDSGVENLSTRLKTPHFRLQTLRLSGCRISATGCAYLASALDSNPSHLKELDLSYNHPGESGIQLLSARLEDPKGTLETLKFDHCAEIRLLPGVRKYACDLTLDPNTAQRNLCLSEDNRVATWMRELQPYPDHPDRFDYWPQVLSRENLSGRSYWEIEWSGDEARIAVTYKSITKKGMNVDSLLGRNDKSWTLYHSSQGYSAWHNNVRTDIPAPSSTSRRVGVYLDPAASTLSFYSVSADTLTPLLTFRSTFTEPLCAALYVWPQSRLSLCKIT